MALITVGVIGVFCILLLCFSIYAGYVAYRENNISSPFLLEEKSLFTDFSRLKDLTELNRIDNATGFDKRHEPK